MSSGDEAAEPHDVERDPPTQRPPPSVPPPSASHQQQPAATPSPNPKPTGRTRLSPLRNRPKSGTPQEQPERSPHAPRHDDHKIKRTAAGTLAISGASARLVALPVRAVPTEPLVPSTVLQSQTQKNLNDRLFYEQQKRAVVREEQEEQKRQQLLCRKDVRLRSDQREDLVQRLTTLSAEQERVTSRRLADKWLVRKDIKKLSMEQQKESTNRMYDERRQKQAEARVALIHKYIESTQIKSRKLTEAEMKASTEKLYNKS
eukprot:Hpha_TRINITY_DN16842_c2_g1::TRINITY_DN16842_c2_g1_i15::g.150205::m.150205